jgi:hypothetical protein
MDPPDKPGDDGVGWWGRAMGSRPLPEAKSGGGALTLNADVVPVCAVRRKTGTSRAEGRGEGAGGGAVRGFPA